MNNVRNIDASLKVGKYLLDRHLVISPLFSEIEPVVTAQTYLTSFAYTRTEENQVELTLEGKTSPYRDSLGEFITQREELKKKDSFKNAYFGEVTFTTGLSEENSGLQSAREMVSFSTTIMLDSNELLYDPERLGLKNIQNDLNLNTSPVTVESVESETIFVDSEDGFGEEVINTTEE